MTLTTEEIKQIEQEAEKYASEFIKHNGIKEKDSPQLAMDLYAAFKTGAKQERERAGKLVEALEYLMEGVRGLPPLTAISGTLIEHFDKAKREIHNYKNKP